MNKRDVLKVLAMDKETALKALDEKFEQYPICPEGAVFQEQINQAVFSVVRSAMEDNGYTGPIEKVILATGFENRGVLGYHWEDNIRTPAGVLVKEIKDEYDKIKNRAEKDAMRMINRKFADLERQILMQGLDVETVAAIQGFVATLTTIVDGIEFPTR